MLWAMATGRWARVASWCRGSTHGRIVSAAAVVAVFAFATKLASAGKEVAVAHQFGTADAVDAFGLALTLPSFVMSLVGGALNSALVPAYIDVRRREGAEAGQRLLSTVLLLAVAVVTAATLLLVALVPLVLPLSSRFSPEKLALTIQLSYLLAPMIVLAGFTSIGTAVLNAHEQFAKASGAGLAVPIVSIVVLFALTGTIGIRSLAVGMVLGYAAEAVFVAGALRREGLSILPRWGGLSEPVRRVIGQYVPMLAGALVMGTNPVVDSMMASRLDPGSVAALGYGNKLVAFGMGIGSLSLGAAIFPHFSKLASARDWSGLSRTIRTYALAILGVTIPVAAAAMIFSEPLARLLYERGAFTAEDTRQVGLVQALYLAQIPFHLTGLLFARFLSASAGNRVLMWLSVVSCGANIAGNIVLSRYLGAAGIALSTSIVYAISFTLLGLSTRRRLRTLQAAEQRAAALRSAV